ncbi:MAG: sulfate adenylyltransferase subunit CysN [Myxococcales bacterium FL481]|nr:MAG: sulfate adenylyltransferase subunit CysN [Myxococcales bacterium FL481]
MVKREQQLKEALGPEAERTVLRFSAVGSVDDGKSTLIGRLLHDTKSIADDQVEALVKDTRMDVGEAPLDFALVTDGLRAEREQGITIDVAYRYFSRDARSFIIADTPGHEQYTRNMATGASTASLAIIVIDARHGVVVQTRRHSFIASLLGIPRLLIAVNKMDLVDYSQDVFDKIRTDYIEFAQRLGIVDLKLIPISALRGDNVVARSEAMPWYHGETVIEYLETVYVGSDRNPVDFRFPVQYVLRPDSSFRGFAGEVTSGRIRVGEEVMVLPSMRKTKIARIATFDGDLDEAYPSQAVVLVLEDEIDVSRGDMLVRPNNVPRVEDHFEAMLVWMNEAPLDVDRTYELKHTTRDVKVGIQALQYRVDVNTLSREPATRLELNEIARVALRTSSPVYFDPYKKNRLTGSFILVDTVSNDTVAAGMVIDRVPSKLLRQQDEELRTKNIYVHGGMVSRQEREAKLGQSAVTIWLTGLSASGKSTIAVALERHLFEEGRIAYRLDGDNVRAGLNGDLGFSRYDRSENIRRVAEVARLFNDAGVVVVAALISPYREDRARAREIVGDSRFLEVHVDTPLEVCKTRDPKGLYAKAEAGEIPSFTGVSDRYDRPESPALRIDGEHTSTEAAVGALMDLLRAR